MWENISLETLYKKCTGLLLMFESKFILALIVLFVGWCGLRLIQKTTGRLTLAFMNE